MNSSKPATPDFLVLSNLGNDISVPIRLSTRAKRVIIRSNYKGIELVMPHNNTRVWYDRAHKFLLSKEAWVRKKLQELSKEQPEYQNLIPIFGKMHSVQQVNYREDSKTLSDSSLGKVEIHDDVIYVHSNPLCHKHILMKFLCDILHVEVKKLSHFFSQQSNLHFTDIKIIKSKGRWGSCSHKAVISFNWRLAFVPKEILEYVVIHEICHIAHMNHGKAFWDLVKKFCPHYKKARSWLKQENNKLHRYLGV
jgi:predicted metal-dependent hydrolase